MAKKTIEEMKNELAKIEAKEKALLERKKKIDENIKRMRKIEIEKMNLEILEAIKEYGKMQGIKETELANKIKDWTERKREEIEKKNRGNENE